MYEDKIMQPFTEDELNEFYRCKIIFIFIFIMLISLLILWFLNYINIWIIVIFTFISFLYYCTKIFYNYKTIVYNYFPYVKVLRDHSEKAIDKPFLIIKLIIGVYVNVWILFFYSNPFVNMTNYSYYTNFFIVIFFVFNVIFFCTLNYFSESISFSKYTIFKAIIFAVMAVFIGTINRVCFRYINDQLFSNYDIIEFIILMLLFNLLLYYYQDILPYIPNIYYLIGVVIIIQCVLMFHDYHNDAFIVIVILLLCISLLKYKKDYLFPLLTSGFAMGKLYLISLILDIYICEILRVMLYVNGYMASLWIYSSLLY